MWFYYSLLAALLNGFANVARRTHGSLADPAELSWWSLVIGIPVNIGLLLAVNTPAFTSHAFIVPMIISGVINALALILQFKAYKLGEVSLVAPIINLLPLLLIGTSFIMLGVVPSFGGIGGVILVVYGVYYSSVSGKHTLRNPIRQLFRNAGSRAMLGTIVMWSISSNLQKISLRSASPAFLALAQASVMFACISIYLLARPRRRRIKRGEEIIRRWGWHITAIAIFATLSVFFEFQALAHTANPTYVQTVKRLDVLITIPFAGYFLHERHLLKRFQGALVALVGVAIIYLAK